ncbi:roadblock/LC7 domain-containing protein [Streptomyces sp. M41]|uniref:roadblock/LC7 domain-containing protein n=1 Tax=Streptomyces sp. M41 TaxID=3059412 RepID=UPI00374D03E8
MIPFSPRPRRRLDWLMDDLVNRVPDIQHAIAVSRDGTPTGASQALTSEDATYLASIVRAVHSIASGAGRRFRAGAVLQTTVELDHALLFIASARHRSYLAAISSPTADTTRINNELTRMAKRLSQIPTTPVHQHLNGKHY